MEYSGPKRIFLWTMPRSRSTVLCKCMSFVENVQVWYEPYLYSYHNELLSMSGRDPSDIQKEAKKGLDEMKNILDQTPIGRAFPWTQFRYCWVKHQLESIEESDVNLTFIKDSAFAIENHYEFLPNVPFRHTFLIRTSSNVPSYRNVFLQEIEEEEDRNFFSIIEDVNVYPTKDLYKKTCQLWRDMATQSDALPIVIDGDELVTYPEQILPKYLNAIGIPFKTQYLNWKAQDDVLRTWKTSYEGIVACADNGWITNAATSSNFLPARPSMELSEMTSDVRECVEFSMPYYEEMIKHRIRP